MNKDLINLASKVGFKSLLEIQDLIPIKSSMCYFYYLCELQKWLREKHNLYVEVYPIGRNKTFHTYKLTSIGDVKLPLVEDNKTSIYHGSLEIDYEKCYEYAILKAIEIISENK